MNDLLTFKIRIKQENLETLQPKLNEIIFIACLWKFVYVAGREKNPKLFMYAENKCRLEARRIARPLYFPQQNCNRTPF